MRKSYLRILAIRQLGVAAAGAREDRSAWASAPMSDLWFDGDVTALIWLIAGVALAAAEALTGDFVLLMLGVDPTLLYVMQFLAVSQLLDTNGVCVLPFRLEELPPAPRAFDTTFSMGVLYHQREPLQHLQELHAVLRPGGELVLETLILPGDELRASTPPDRYARMRNVWLLPTLPQLLNWLADCGFSNSRVADVSVTTVAEQRPTEWMRFESLQQALDPDNPELTVEGWPRPRRAVLVSRAVA